MLDLKRKPSANRYDEQRQLGIATVFLMQPGDFRPRLAQTLDDLLPAIWHGQVMYFQDEYGTLRSIAFYAGLTERVERGMLSRDDIGLHETEWNEGDRYWIVAFAIESGGIRAAIRSLREEMGRFTDVIYFRRVRPRRATPQAWAIHTRGAPRPRRLSSDT